VISDATTQKKHSEILLAATELFFERGYEGVSVDAIVERVGGSKTTVYSYFGGKDGLFAAVIEKTCGEFMKPLLELDLAYSGPKLGLRRIGEQFLSTVTSESGRALFLAVMSESRRFPYLAERFFAAGPGTCIRAVRLNIEHWQKEGLLRAGNPEVMAEQFIGMLMGTLNVTRLLGLTGPLSESEMKTRVQRTVTTFLDGVLPHP